MTDDRGAAWTLTPSDRPAFFCAGGPVSYAVIVAEVAGVAALLQPGEAWLLVPRSRRHLAVAAVACAVSGATFVLPPSFASAALARAAEGCAGVLHDGAPQVTAARDIDLTTVAPGAAAEVTLALHPRVCARLHTSGSTGAARDVEKSVAQLFGEALTLAGTFGLRADDRVITSVPTHHIYGLLFGALAPLVAGAAIDDTTPLLPEEVAGRVSTHQGTVLVSVPAHLRAIADVAPAGLETLRRVFSSGSALPEATAAAWCAPGRVDVTEVFGSTETGGVAWRQQRIDPRWTPFAGVLVWADAEERMWLRSPLTATPGPVATDDRVEVGPDGRFAHHGRLDDVVKVASRRVSLTALERAILGVPGVLDAALLAAQDDARGTALRAAFTGAATVEQVRAALLDAFDPVVIPRLTRVDALPRSPAGKLPRSALLALFGLQPDAPSSHTLHIAADHPAFQGHFPGQPILPGAALLAEVAALAERRWQVRVTGAEVATFHRPIPPDCALQITLTRDDARVRFRVERDGDAAATGILRVTSPPGAPE